MSRTSIGRRLRAQVLADAGGRCGYCLSSEEVAGAPLEIEHLLPEARGGPTRRTNLWAACRQCNALKGMETLTFFIPLVRVAQDIIPLAMSLVRVAQDWIHPAILPRRPR